MSFLSSFVLIFTLLKMTSCDFLTETPFEEAEYHYCESQNIFGDEIEVEFENLKRCHVIEGHLRLHRLALPEGASLPNLIQVTDYIILERLEGLESLAVLFPRLSVIRGQNLFFDKYALVLHGNLYLEEIGPWILSSILHGAVHIESNIFLCTDEEIDWNELVRSSYRRFNFFKNNLDFCPFMGCEKEGYCNRREKTCKTLGLSCPNVTVQDCSSECIGGCYKAFDPSACVACKNFEYSDGNMSTGVKKCVKNCSENLLNFMNYRCITYEECHLKNYSVLNPNDTAFLDEEIMSPKDLSGKEKMYRKYKNDVKCIKDCPKKFIQYHNNSSNSQKKMRLCKLKRVCETTIITNNNLGENLKYCNHVDGNLIIFVAGGRNVTQQLEENLKRIETVSGYVKVAGADALYSLSFLSNLKRIEGKEVVNGGEYHKGYSFYLVENSNLKELWDWDFRSKELHINGSVYIHFNDRLCDSEIAKFKKIANIKDENISNYTNGISAPCRIFHTHLNAVPGSRNGSIILSWMHNFCAVDSRYIYGYQVFYRPVNKNISKYQGRDVCNNNRLFKRNVAELKVVHEPMCMEMELKCLTPNTRYAIYIESIAVDNIKHQIESSIVYATTYNDHIEKPRKEKLELRNDSISLSWKHPKVPSYIVPEEIFYEIILTLNGDPTQDLSKGATVIQEPEDCLCSSLSKDTFFIKKQKKESIAIENEISSLIYRRTKNNTSFHSREKRSQSSSQTYEEHDATCGLKSYRISSSSDYQNNACETMRSNSSDCKKPRVQWSSSSLKFKKAILTSSWNVKDAVYRKTEKTENTSIIINLPENLSSMPKKISVEIRSCVGEIRPCPPLHSEESCSICSDFLSFVTSTIDNSSLPNFEVELWEENDSNNSGHKSPYVPCKKISTYDDISTFHIVEEIENGQSVNDESSNGSVKRSSSPSFLNISWTEPMDLLNFILGYRILYYNMDDSEKEAIGIYISKSVAQEMGNRFTKSVERSSEKYVGFQIHYQGGYGRINEKCLTVPQNEGPGYFIYLIWCGFIVLGALSMACVYKFSKEIWSENLHSKSGKKSCEYSSKLYATLRRFDERFRVERDQLSVTVNEKLGSGFFGNIYKGTVTKKDCNNSTDSVIPVAVKTINPAGIENSHAQAFDELLEEGIIMQKFDCFFVVKLIAISVNIVFGHPSLCIAMEYMDTDLKKYLMDLKTESLSEETMIEILSQVSIGMSYLHDNHFIHRDLAARNCLVQHIGTEGSHLIVVKVADFGLARSLNEDYMYVQSVRRPIPVRWTSPEALTDSAFNRECDVWSFGVLIYEIVTKCVDKPYNCGTRKYTDEEVKELIPLKGVTLRLPSNRSKFLRLLMEDCLKFDPKARPTFTEIVHKLLSSGIPTDDFVTWCESLSHLHKSGSVDSKSDSFNDDNYISASTLEPCDNEMDDESDYDDNACLAPKKCGQNQSSCLSINCVHNTIFCRKNRMSKSEFDDLSFRQELNY